MVHRNFVAVDTARQGAAALIEDSRGSAVVDLVADRGGEGQGLRGDGGRARGAAGREAVIAQIGAGKCDAVQGDGLAGDLAGAVASHVETGEGGAGIGGGEVVAGDGAAQAARVGDDGGIGAVIHLVVGGKARQRHGFRRDGRRGRRRAAGKRVVGGQAARAVGEAVAGSGDRLGDDVVAAITGHVLVGEAGRVMVQGQRFTGHASGHAAPVAEGHAGGAVVGLVAGGEAGDGQGLGIDRRRGSRRGAGEHVVGGQAAIGAVTQTVAAGRDGLGDDVAGGVAGHVRAGKARCVMIQRQGFVARVATTGHAGGHAAPIGHVRGGAAAAVVIPVADQQAADGKDFRIDRGGACGGRRRQAVVARAAAAQGQPIQGHRLAGHGIAGIGHVRAGKGGAGVAERHGLAVDHAVEGAGGGDDCRGAAVVGLVGGGKAAHGQGFLVDGTDAGAQRGTGQHIVAGAAAGEADTRHGDGLAGAEIFGVEQTAGRFADDDVALVTGNDTRQSIIVAARQRGGEGAVVGFGDRAGQRGGERLRTDGQRAVDVAGGG